MYSLSGKRVWIAGHRGMVGAALVRRLANEQVQVLTVDRKELDLVDQTQVSNWVNKIKPDVIVIAAAKVGGIHANDRYPADFIYNNLMIEANIIHSAHVASVPRLLFLGSSCIYPKLANQPINEESLLSGQLEPTNEWYAIAKIAGIKLVQAYRKQFGYDWISAMPTNLYGPGDNYDLETSHVLPALVRKFHEAKINGNTTVKLWGSGTPLREFMHCDDLADALVFLLKTYSGYSHINVGSTYEVTIKQLSEIVARVVGYNAEIFWDKSKPDGAPRKLMNSSKLTDLGWKNCRDLENGIRSTYNDFLHKLSDLV